MVVFRDAENRKNSPPAVDEWVQQVLDSAPVLSDEKREYITAIFAGGDPQ